MKATILHVLCEGQTEEKFVKEVLSPFLNDYNIYTKPILLLTSRKKNARGGMLSYLQAKGDLERLIAGIHDSEYERHIFTTMFDYYALPNDFPGMAETVNIVDVRQKIQVLEQRLWEEFQLTSLIPYIQLHEFEALMFADITKLTDEYPEAAKEILGLQQEAEKINDPELINNKPETAPSKRIIKALEKKYNYNKVKSGTATLKRIGIPVIMDRCQHFKAWVSLICEKANESHLR